MQQNLENMHGLPLGGPMGDFAWCLYFTKEHVWRFRDVKIDKDGWTAEDAWMVEAIREDARERSGTRRPDDQWDR
jgi:hypothetical protein